MKTKRKNSRSLGDVEEILSTSDLSKVLSEKGYPCAESSIRNWVKQGMPVTKIHGRFFFILRKSLDWLRAGEKRG